MYGTIVSSMLNQLEQVADMADGVRGQRGALVLTGVPGTQLSEQVVGRRDACEHQQRRTAHRTCQRDVSVQPIADHASAPAVWTPRAQ